MYDNCVQTVQKNSASKKLECCLGNQSKQHSTNRSLRCSATYFAHHLNRNVPNFKIFAGGIASQEHRMFNRCVHLIFICNYQQHFSFNNYHCRGRKKTYPLGHFATVRVMVMKLQNDNCHHDRHSHNHHGAGKVLGCECRQRRCHVVSRSFLNVCPLEQLATHKQVKQTDEFALRKRLISRPHIKGEASPIDLCSRLFCQGQKMNICTQTGKVKIGAKICPKKREQKTEKKV